MHVPLVTMKNDLSFTYPTVQTLLLMSACQMSWCCWCWATCGPPTCWSPHECASAGSPSPQTSTSRTSTPLTNIVLFAWCTKKLKACNQIFYFLLVILKRETCMRFIDQIKHLTCHWTDHVDAFMYCFWVTILKHISLLIKHEPYYTFTIFCK